MYFNYNYDVLRDSVEKCGTFCWQSCCSSEYISSLCILSKLNQLNCHRSCLAEISKRLPLASFMAQNSGPYTDLASVCCVKCWKMVVSFGRMAYFGRACRACVHAWSMSIYMIFRDKHIWHVWKNMKNLLKGKAEQSLLSFTGYHKLVCALISFGDFQKFLTSN